MGTVLVVDDQERVVTFLCRMLAAEGHRTLTASDGAEALRVLATEPVDLVLLDLVMPSRSGLQVLSALRERGDRTPVIVLSAVPDVAARVRALDTGAVDFVSKPFSTAELAARVRRNMLPRDRGEAAGDRRRLEVGGVGLDTQQRLARHGDTEVLLSARESALLAHLMRNADRVCGRDELLREVWGIDFDPRTNVVEVCVGRLRRKLPGIPLRTVRSAGYCFAGS